jgi:hypothetical protein
MVASESNEEANKAVAARISLLNMADRLGFLNRKKWKEKD